IAVRFRSDLYTAPTIERFIRHLLRVLQSAVQAPETRLSALAIVSRAEESALAAGNATTVDEGPAATLVELFESQAARVPSRVAAVGSNASVTYAEMNARANRLARVLRAKGAGRGTFVALALDRSVDA